MIRLLIGGSRSGKSHFAEMIAKAKGRDNVIYLATAEVRDGEMKERVEQHKQSRPEKWQTIEEPYQVSKALEKIPTASVVLLDCITVLVSNILMQGEYAAEGETNFEAKGCESDVLTELESLLKIAREKELELIMVSNEVGLGLVPAYKLGREYRDISGRANQFLAREADEVYLLFAGLPVEIKEIGMKNLARFS